MEPMRLSHKIAVWPLCMEFMRHSNKVHFPGTRFGSNTEKLLVLAATVMFYSEKIPANPSKLSEYLEMPRQSVSRHLACLEKKELVMKWGGRYVPTEKTHIVYTQEMLKQAQKACHHIADMLLAQHAAEKQLAAVQKVA